MSNLLDIYRTLSQSLELFYRFFNNLKQINMSNKTEINKDSVFIGGVEYTPKSSQNQKVIELNGEESVWEIGKNYLIRTVTMIQLGKLKKVTDKELVLSEACWVADTGRFSEALQKGTLREIEMFQKDVIVSRGGIIDATEWISELPKTTK